MCGDFTMANKVLSNQENVKQQKTHNQKNLKEKHLKGLKPANKLQQQQELLKIYIT